MEWQAREPALSYLAPPRHAVPARAWKPAFQAAAHRGAGRHGTSAFRRRYQDGPTSVGLSSCTRLARIRRSDCRSLASCALPAEDQRGIVRAAGIHRTFESNAQRGLARSTSVRMWVPITDSL